MYYFVYVKARETFSSAGRVSLLKALLTRTRTRNYQHCCLTVSCALLATRVPVDSYVPTVRSALKATLSFRQTSKNHILRIILTASITHLASVLKIWLMLKIPCDYIFSYGKCKVSCTCPGHVPYQQL